MPIQYQLLDASTIKKTDLDGATSFGPPNDPTSAFAVAYQAWLGLGNTPAVAPLQFSRQQQVVRQIQTTDATTTEIYRLPLAPLTGYRLVGTLLGIDSGNGSLRMIDASVVAKRLSGSALLVGPPVVIANHQDAGASTWSIGAAVAGNDLVISVTGAAGRALDWFLEARTISFTPAGA